MVFRGQDAWRKHPLLANCAANPFPHFRLALGIFAVYCVADYTIHYFTAPPPKASSIRYKVEKGDLEGHPAVIVKKGGHH
ncbi:hypothetical protein B484DRAFT_454789 [Ochromonadaceae sp. CCMP2298]|nr:hypothetical protein B484DRAFT_454789 [Ochromonadaceae sp. CCMP2298]